MWNIDEFLSGLNIDLDRLRDVFTYDPQAPMIFSSGIFLWLFVAFILVYLLLQRRTTARLLFVTLFSYYGICIYNHRTTKTNQKYPSVNL